jgi:hypothetical protein
MEGTESREHNAEEPAGVGGAGCGESQRWNRGDLTRPAAHIRRHGGYKPDATSRGTSREKSEEAIVLKTIETTPLEAREGPLLQPGLARRSGMVQAQGGPTTPRDHSRERQRRLY